MIALGDLLHFRSGIGDGDEMAAGLVLANRQAGAGKEVLLENVGLESRSRFAGNDEQSFRRIQAVKPLDLRGIGRIEHVQLREARDVSESFVQNFGAEAGPAHAEQENIGEAGGFYVRRQGAEIIDVGDLIVGDRDGIAVIPAALADEVAKDAAEQEELEEYLLQRVTGGAALPGTYPPNEATRAAFEQWRTTRQRH